MGVSMPSPVSFRLGIPPGGAEASGEEAASPSPEADTINIIFKGRFQGVGPATHTHLHPLSRREPLPEEQLAKSSTPGFAVFRYLLEFAQTHVH